MLLSSVDGTLLFLSVDVVGSTPFKQAHAADSGWIPPFARLFREFPLVFTGEIGVAFAEADELVPFGVWKVIGDEIVFVAAPRTRQDAQRVLKGFAAAVARYSATLHADYGLKLRGIAWSADVSGRNMKVEIPEMSGGPEGGVYVDVLGPDIDFGFRLGSHAEGAEVALSYPLALLMLELGETEAVRWLGLGVLKGVLGGHALPLFLLRHDRASRGLAVTAAQMNAHVDEFLADLGPVAAQAPPRVSLPDEAGA